MTAFAAVLTAPTRGAVAVVRVWGPESVALADAVFRPNRGPGLASTPNGRLRVGRIGAGLGDEVVVVRDGEPPEVEIQCHGGPAAVGLVLGALRTAGVVEVEPQAWLDREAGSRLAALAMDDLARAPTVRTAEILLEQAQGALDSELERLARLAAGDGADEALDGIEGLLARSTVGLRLVEGWRVALAGRPNVGKSRLLNALAGFDRAIVSATPGTTRDVVTVRTAIDGWPVELADTAGLRESDDPIEAAGIARARARQARADLVVLVLDRSEPRVEADAALLDGLPAALIVASKADLPAAWDAEDLGALVVSAERGDGLGELLAAIGRRLVPDPPGPGAAVPFRSEIVRTLERARRRLREGRGARAARRLRRMTRPGQ
jgi:tRNA modification GTPase